MTNARQRWKQWLLRKTHGLFGVSRLHGQLAQIGEELRHTQALTAELHRSTAELLQIVSRNLDGSAQAAAGSVTALNQLCMRLAEIAERKADVAPPPPGPLAVPVADEEALRALEPQGLYVFGAGRSGTTILTRSLNRAREILVLEEPNFFLHEHVPNFVGFFNQLHASMGNRRMKGTYLAPPLAPEAGALATLQRLRRDYRYLGEKTAIGPHDYPRDWQHQYLDFQSKYFLRAKYIHILRTPVETLWAMHKLFPDRPVARLFEAWLRAVALSLDAYRVFPNSRMVFFEDLGPSMIERLAEWLDVSVPCLPGTFGRTYITSAVNAGEMPDVLRPYTGFCRECTDLYRDLRESFSRNEHVYCGNVSEWHYFTRLLHQIENMLQRLPAEVAGDECASRAALSLT